MKRLILFICTFVSLTISAQKVSESEAFQKAQKFLSDKKLKAPCATTRGGEVYSPYYIFNAEDGNGCVIISGDERLPEVLAYSKEESIDENNLPEGLEEILPILKVKGGTRGDTYGDIPSEYVPRNTTPIPCLMGYAWRQTHPFSMYCPIIRDEGTLSDIHALVGCGPLAISEVMAYFKYPKSVDSFNTVYPVKKEGEKNYTGVEETVPYTEFKWDLIRNDYYNSSWSDEEKEAAAELCYHVGRAFKVIYKPGGTTMNFGKEYIDWENKMKNIYKYEEAEFIQGQMVNHYNESDGSSTWEYFELPDEDYWNFLDSYLERGIPVIAGGDRHIFVIDGRDDKGMYCWIDKHLYVILQPSLWREIGEQGALVKYNYFLTLFACVPPKEYIPEPKKATSIVNTKVENNKDGFIYNLQGHKMGDTFDGLSKGIYIKDGKKYLIK